MSVEPRPSVAPHVALSRIRVRFGDLLALDSVDLTIEPGAKVAVVGENGAGKSTLMRVLFGQIAPDSGEISLDKVPVAFRSPADAIRRGIGMVQQHFELIERFSVAENVVLGAEPGAWGVVDRHAARERVAELSERAGLAIDPDALVETLSLAARQRVEILKALYRDAKILILDEPTAVLSPAESRDFWRVVQTLTDAKTSVVFITHKLDDVFANADSVTVLRRGKRVLSAPLGDTDPETTARAMVGETGVPGNPAARRSPTRAPGETRVPRLKLDGISVNDDRGARAVDGVSLEIAPGEIVGIAGVDGSGQTEWIEALVGLRRLESGAIFLDGAPLPASVRGRRDAGVAFLPDDRHRWAIASSLSQADNAILGKEDAPAFASAGFQKSGPIQAAFESLSQRFDVRGAGAGRPVSSLSGGNQQKLVVARELSGDPKLIVTSQPTRGLDFGATARVHDALRLAADSGASVLVQSLDLDELLGLCDRIAVIVSGRIAGVVSGETMTVETIGSLMTRSADAARAEAGDS